MGDKGKGKDKGKTKKAPKPSRHGLRPHEKREQADAVPKKVDGAGSARGGA